MNADDRLAAIEARLGELEDREAIRNLIAGYGPAADSGASAEVAQMWTETGGYDVGGIGISAGRSAIGALIEGETHRGLMADGVGHVLSPVRISLSGERAVAVGYSCIFQWTGAGFQVFRVAANRWDLTKTTAGWRVDMRTNRLLDGDEAARALLHPGAAINETGD